MKFSYRPEIDGLRAIAVGAIILYHSNSSFFGYQPFNGGFIGVDIFFVISGYLITSIILKELILTGSFSFKNFYERRIRRIFPALLFVMLISLPFAWMYLLPSNLIDFSKSILYSLGFSSNFYFHYTGQEYGSDDGLIKPFLHTWSLSVEKQFYILFPIVLLITFKYFKKYLLVFLIVCFFISISIADWGSKNYASANFYFLHSRMWELLAGSILAYLEIRQGFRSKNQILNKILPLIGLLLIAHSIIFFNEKTFHPSFYSSSPIIGICLVIWFSDKNTLITKILSSKLLVGIGLISYSLYLWHYPIFAFSRIYGFTDDSLIKELFLGLIIFILSIISYFLVEKKFRNKSVKFLKILPLLIFILIINILSTSIFIKKKGLYDYLPEIYKSSLSYEKIWTLLKNDKNQICHNLNEVCSFKVKNEKNKVYLIGDSVMGSLSYDLKRRLNKSGYSFYSYTMAGCPFFENGWIEGKFNKIYHNCDETNTSKRNSLLLNDTKKIIIIGAKYPLYIEQTILTSSGEEKGGHYFKSSIHKNYEEGFLHGVHLISSYKNNHIILLTPLPELEYNLSRKIQQETNFNRLTIKNQILNLNNKIFKEKIKHNQRTKRSKNMLNKFKNIKNITIIDTDNIFCKSAKKCILMNNDSYFLLDESHPSLKGANMINDIIIQEIVKIELKSN